MGFHIEKITNFTPEQTHELVTAYGPSLKVNELIDAVSTAEGDHHAKEFRAYSEDMHESGRTQPLSVDDMVRLHVAGKPDHYEIETRSAGWRKSIEATAKPGIERVAEIKDALKPGVLVVKIEDIQFNLDLSAIHENAQNVRVGYVAEEPLTVTDPRQGIPELGYSSHVGVRVGALRTPEQGTMGVRIGELLHATAINSDEVADVHRSRFGGDYLSIYGALLVGNEAVKGLVEVLRKEQAGDNDWAIKMGEENYTAIVDKIASERTRYVAEHVVKHGGELAEPAIDLPETLAS